MNKGNSSSEKFRVQKPHDFEVMPSLPQLASLLEEAAPYGLIAVTEQHATQWIPLHLRPSKFHSNLHVPLPLLHIVLLLLHT